MYFRRSQKPILDLCINLEEINFKKNISQKTYNMKMKTKMSLSLQSVTFQVQLFDDKTM